jgi:hypothetical protein
MLILTLKQLQRDGLLTRASSMGAAQDRVWARPNSSPPQL